MSILEIEFMDGKKLELEIEECSDQAGFFSWRGDAAQAKRYDYVAARNGIAVTLNGEAGKGIDRYPMESIRRLRERGA